MEKSFKITKFICSSLIFGLGFLQPSVGFAEGSPIYYDTFYNDYYKSFPDTKPKKKETKAVKTQPIQPMQVVGQPTYYNGYDPYMQYQTSAVYNQSYNPYASFYQKVDHDPKRWEFDIKYKKGEGQFMFKSDVGSILNWDELQTNETVFTISRDFMIRNRQYVFSASYGTGKYTTDRTSDDDVFNEAHIISLGKGNANLTDLSFSFGARNLYNWAGFDVTPVIGYKRKKQEFEMSDHATPAPFYLEYFCDGATESDPTCVNGINLVDHGLTVDDIYTPDGSAVDTSDLFIPGVGIDASGNSYTNLSYGMQIYDEDFCFVTQTGKEVCIYSEATNGSNNILKTFGGVSSVNITEGVTHMYHVTWEGPFIGVNLERMISPRETLLVYGELFKPSYKVWGNWPNRDDWAHDPSFYDKGGSAWGASFDATYKYRIKNSTEFTIGFNYEYIKEKNADTHQFFADGTSEVYKNSILLARWKHYGIAIGLAFKL